METYGETYAGVYLLDAPFSIDRAFDYYVPLTLKADVRAGAFVTVPFGGANRRKIGLVASVGEKAQCAAENIKPVISVCPDTLFLDEALLGLVFFLKEHTLCTAGEAVHAMIPAAAFSKKDDAYRALPGKNEKDTRYAEVLAFIREHSPAPESVLKEMFGQDVKKALSSLASDGYIKKEATPSGLSAAQSKSIFSLALPEREIKLILENGEGAPVKKLRSEKQKAVLSALLSAESGFLTQEELKALGANAATIKPLIEKGLVKEEKKAVYRNPYGTGGKGNPEKIELNREQNEAFETLRALADSGEARAALLYGVTGSGKTSVMTVLIDHMLSKGKGVIMLLPEISLTPQTIGLFRRRYGDLCAVVHSSLSAGERYDAYLRIKSGDARVVIGTRSAVFSPVKNLGLIVIDEEQENTYKSDQNPKYHARDAARYRCAAENALMLLASATPSLESYLKAKEGKYTLVKLKNRYGGASLPTVTIADMRGEAAGGNLSPIGERLTAELVRVKNEGKQSILFLNRRGYNTFVSCRGCGEALACPRCSVSLTYHTKPGTYEEGYLACHWCGYRAPLPKTCPKCSSPHLAHMGYGTQRVEQELSELVPGARVIRMDTDTTKTKFSYDRLLGAFRKGEADILLGTQMVTKGHDFPSVTLVGVLLADASLYLDDYRASERTFSMLTQVIGRAGRASDKGEAIIQTNNPDSDVIKLACAQDYETFFEREIKLRRLLVFPPFCDIVLMTISSEDESDLFIAVKILKKLFDSFTGEGGKYYDVQTVAFGPFEAPIYKVDGKCRMRMVIKCRLNRRSRELFAEILRAFAGERASGYGKKSKKPFLSVDFNPSSL